MTVDVSVWRERTRCFPFSEMVHLGQYFSQLSLAWKQTKWSPLKGLCSFSVILESGLHILALIRQPLEEQQQLMIYLVFYP